jgi:hypothetical protein
MLELVGIPVKALARFSKLLGSADGPWWLVGAREHRGARAGRGHAIPRTSIDDAKTVISASATLRAAATVPAGVILSQLPITD